MQNTGDDLSTEDWGELLGALTLEELRQYGQIALDQLALAGRWFWLQIVALVWAVGIACWGIWSDLKTGLKIESVYWIAPVVIVIYWIYRSAKARKLWSRHFAAVNGEFVRRGKGMMRMGSELK